MFSKIRCFDGAVAVCVFCTLIASNIHAQALPAAASSMEAPYSPLVSFNTLPALQSTTLVPNSSHVPGDFDGDGTSDLLWFNPSLSQVGYWTMADTVGDGPFGSVVTRKTVHTFNVTPGYFVGATGDFNNDGYADLVFTSANRDLWLWTNNQNGSWTSTKMGDYPSQWQLVGAGDIDGDGYDDLLWLDPSDCQFAYWTMRGVVRTGYKIFNVACGYYPISIGYYSTSNRISILWTSPANDLYIWDSTGSGFKSYDLTSYIPLQATDQLFAIGGGYQGVGMGAEWREFTTDGTPDAGRGVLYSRTFDVNGNQTGMTQAPVWGGAMVGGIGSGGYLIEGNGINATGIYHLNVIAFTISTGGLLGESPYSSGNAPCFPGPCGPYYGDSWTYPQGWWVVGALANGTAPLPWK